MTAAPTRSVDPSERPPRSRAARPRSARCSPPRSAAPPAAPARRTTDDLDGYTPRKPDGRGRAALRGGPAPGQPVLLRHHAQAGQGRTPRGRRPAMVRATAQPEGDQGQADRQDRALVAEPAPQPRRPLAAPERRHRGRLGGHGRLRPLGADAPDDLEAAAARGDDRVLREPPARGGGRGPAVRAPGRLRQHHPQARAGPLRPDAAGDHDPPGDADLPRRGGVDQGAPQREPRPRAARAAHRRRRSTTPRRTSATRRGS